MEGDKYLRDIDVYQNSSTSGNREKNLINNVLVLLDKQDIENINKIIPISRSSKIYHDLRRSRHMAGPGQILNPLDLTPITQARSVLHLFPI